MNSIVGKSTGIALLMAAALLAALFAMGVFSATGVGAQNGPKAIVASDEEYSTTAVDPTDNIMLTVEFDIDGAGATGDTVTVDLGDYVAQDSTDADGFQLGTVLLTDAGGPIAQGETAIRDPASVTLATNENDGPVYTAADNTVKFTLSGALLEDPDTEDNVRMMITITVVRPTDVINCFGQSEWALDSVSDTADENALARLAEARTKNISSCEPGAAIRVDVGGNPQPAPADSPYESNAVNEDIVVDLTGFTLPPTISESNVLIYKGTAARNPGEVSVNSDKVTLTVPNYVLPPTAAVGLEAGAYRIVFKQSAGVANPAAAGAKTIKITDNDEDDATTEEVDEGTESHDVVIQRVVKLSSKSVTRGDEITATLKGFANNTATVSLENEDDTVELGKVQVSGNSGEFIFSTKPSTVAANDTNFVIVTDAAGIAQDVKGEFTLRPAVSIDPSSSAVAKTVEVTLTDWAEDDAVTSVKIGAADATPRDDEGEILSDLEPDSKGKLVFDILVPAAALTGSQTLKITGTDPDPDDDDVDAATASTSITVGVLELDIKPGTVVPGQQITIKGIGFVAGDRITMVEISDNSVTIEESIEAKYASSGGEVIIPLIVPSDEDKPIGNGVKKVKIISTGPKLDSSEESSGRQGEGTIEIPEATFTLDPSTSRRGTTVNVSGSGFPAGDLVQIQYFSGKADDFITVNAKASDSTGNVDVDFTVPSFADIGQEHEVRAVSVGVYASIIVDDIMHSTPGANVILGSTDVIPGTQLTIRGENFPAYSTVAQMQFGGQDIRPVPSPSTSVDGDFETTVLVPQGDLGTETITVKVGSTTHTSNVTVIAATTSTDPANVFAPLGDRLVRVWYLDRATQVWSFYDPDSDVAAFNTLTEVSSGQNVSIIISPGANIEFQDMTLYPGTNPIALD